MTTLALGNPCALAESTTRPRTTPVAWAPSDDAHQNTAASVGRAPRTNAIGPVLQGRGFEPVRTRWALDQSSFAGGCVAVRANFRAKTPCRVYQCPTKVQTKPF